MPIALDFRTEITEYLSERPIETNLGVILNETRNVEFGTPGGRHDRSECWVYSAQNSGILMLFSFYKNFTQNDFICKVIRADEELAEGCGATLQFRSCP